MNINEIAGFTPLVKDYLTRFESSAVRAYFELPPEPSKAHFEQLLKARLAAQAHEPATKRQTLVQNLRAFHERNALLSPAIEANLTALSEPNTFAVVTGQQVSIFGGPLYSFYKTLTTIELAKRYAAEHEAYTFVPVFWLETEDHDIAEASSIHVLDKDSELRTIRYQASDMTDSDEKPWRFQVGPTPLEKDAIETAFTELESALAPGEFTADLVARLKRCYMPGRSFAEAFASLLFEFFGEDGLIIMDANNRAVKGLARELFQKEIETSPQLSERILRQSVQLEESYHAQVKPKALNLFYVDESGERYPLLERDRTEKGERSFFLKGSRKTFTLAELNQILQTAPERFSPNVAMRPLYQDTLLPTVSYVAGPGEIAYFAQFKTAYEWAGIPMPVIAPRLTATLVEERFEKVFEKFALTPEELIASGRERIDAMLAALVDPELTASFEQAIDAIDQKLESLREPVKGTDATLDGALTGVKGKVLTAVRDLQSKTLAAERKRHAATKSKLEKLLVAILPEDTLQERELSILYFLNKYGWDALGRLKTALAEHVGRADEHHVVHLAAVNSYDGAFAQSDSEKKHDSAATGRTSGAPEPFMAVPDEQSA